MGPRYATTSLASEITATRLLEEEVRLLEVEVRLLEEEVRFLEEEVRLLEEEAMRECCRKEIASTGKRVSRAAVR